MEGMPLYATPQELRLADSAGVVTSPETVVIPDGDYSEGFNPGSAKNFTLEVTVHDGNAAGDILVEKGDDQEFTNVITHDTIAVNGFRTGIIANDGPAFGHYRIKNESGQDVTVRLQQYV